MTGAYPTAAFAAVDAFNREMSKGPGKSWHVTRRLYLEAREFGALVLPGLGLSTEDLDELFADEEEPV